MNKEENQNSINLQSSTFNLQSYHTPVMLQECIDGLNIRPDGIYVDLTFGGGGHSREILKKLDTGKLFSFDQDRDVKSNADRLTAEFETRFAWVEANFRYFKKYLKLYGVTHVDGVLADLGVSSHQFDTAERGFSFRFDANLDMRMDTTSGGETAADILNTREESDLHKIFGMYGEIQNARTLANAVIQARTKKKILTTGELKAITSKYTKRGQENKYNAQVFQALRIAVNDELKALEEMLVQNEEVIKPGGRLVIMTYHSLEDKLVKNYIKNGKLFGEAEKDLFGNTNKPFEAVNRKPIEATEAEIARNGRARSAKLRIGERVF